MREPANTSEAIEQMQHHDYCIALLRQQVELLDEQVDNAQGLLQIIQKPERRERAQRLHEIMAGHIQEIKKLAYRIATTQEQI